MQEEVLYKYPLTHYPDIDEITTLLDPFVRLFTVIVKWQKAERKLVLCFASTSFIIHFPVEIVVFVVVVVAAAVTVKVTVAATEVVVVVALTWG